MSEVKGEITFENVKFAYPVRPHITVFEDLSLTIPPKTTAALVGPSGSGKSTVIAMLERFYDPAGGCVKLDGHNLKDLNVSWLRLQMALVQQEPVLFAGSILDNIKYGKDAATEEEVTECAKMSNAHDFIMTFPDTYKTACGDRGAQLSGGQKQRIAIARAMIRRPKILLLDEATSALDTESEKIVQEAIDKVLSTSDVTTIVIAHRLSTIQNAHAIHVVHGGRIVESGTHEELMVKPDGQYKQLVDRQERH